MSQLAKALYDNTAECTDELAFKRGDILTVIDQNVVGTGGWWMCTLYGRHGLAPANRLRLLPQAEILKNSSGSSSTMSKETGQNIYQIPCVPKSIPRPVYECMRAAYKVPSSSQTTPFQSPFWQSTGALEGDKQSFSSMASGVQAEVYNVPSQARPASLLMEPSPPKTNCQGPSFLPNSHGTGSSGTPRSNSPGDSCGSTYPSFPEDPNYDIPVPSSIEIPQKVTSSCNTLPSSNKSEWIYDVPAGTDKRETFNPNNYNTLPPKDFCSQVYDTLPLRSLPAKKDSPVCSFYDIPKPSCLEGPSPSKDLPNLPASDKVTTHQLTEESVYDVPPKKEELCLAARNTSTEDRLLESRDDSSHILKSQRLCEQQMGGSTDRVSYQALSSTGDSPVQVGHQDRVQRQSSRDSKRISTTSSSSSGSSSSCDSTALSSSSPEPLRKVTLGQEEACHKLLGLQESLVRAVPQLMVFVSRHWRQREHLEKYLEEIKEAAEQISKSLMCFLNFTVDIKGNADRLSDTNLQTRLYKQLSIVEDSGVILQQTVNDLNLAGWPLETLCQDPSQAQIPDQLDRFVMVARTVPDDVKRLVSIIYANSKLLFKGPHKTTVCETTADHPTGGTCSDPDGDTIEDNNDYVELEVKYEGNTLKENPKGSKTHEKVDFNCPSSVSGIRPEAHRPSFMSEHCRLYFGALQKAIGGFVVSLQDGQPPEKFISQSKLVIMVGQRLVDTLCREAHRGGQNQQLLCKSNHLCALLKQLAVATKKAALHFPEKEALHEAQEFAKELAQRAQHFRTSLDL